MAPRRECGPCEFFVKYGSPKDTGDGECRRFPPVLSFPESREAKYPPVWGHQWCGEFKERETP